MVQIGFPLQMIWISMESLACTALSVIGRALLHYQGHVRGVSVAHLRPVLRLLRDFRIFELPELHIRF